MTLRDTAIERAVRDIGARDGVIVQCAAAGVDAAFATLRDERDAIAQAIRPHVYGLLDADDRARLAADAVLALLAEREGDQDA